MLGREENTVETVSLWRCITVLQLIKLVEQKEKYEAQYYFGEEKKHLNKNLINQLLIITDNMVNSLMPYLKIGKIFGLLLVSNVFRCKHKRRSPSEHYHCLVNKLSVQVRISKEEQKLICC